MTDNHTDFDHLAANAAAILADLSADELELALSDVRECRRALDNKPWGVSIANEFDRLRSLENELTAALNKVRPYRIVGNGPTFLVCHKGMFVCDETGENWIGFDSHDQAREWIAAKVAA